MARILILGGYGLTGRALAHHLLRQTAVELDLAGRRLDKAEAFAAELNAQFSGNRVAAVRADAASRQDLCAALPGVDLLLVAAPTAQHADTVITAALDSGVDYLDVQFDARKLALLQARAADIERQGRCFITEAGFHPGLPSAMVRYAAAHMDRVAAATVACYLNMGRSLPYSEAVDELMEAFRHYQAQVYEDGAWTDPGAFKTRNVDFGGAIGVRNCYSMFFEEMRDLPRLVPTLHELGFYISETSRIVDWVITPLVMAGLKIAPRRGVRPLGKLMWWGMQTFPKPPYLVVLKVEASGEQGGKPARFEAAVSHPDGYALTAIPVVACLQQLLDGSARRPGVWMMGHLVEPVRLFADMAQMGVTITSEVDHVRAT